MEDKIKKLKDKRKFFTIWMEWFMDDPKHFNTEIQLCEIQLIEIAKQLNLLKK